jgi:hypothetical protein
VYHRRALEDHEKTLGTTFLAVNNVGALLQAQGKLGMAERSYRRALDGRERTLGRNHPYTLTPVNNLGSLLRSVSLSRSIAARSRGE